MVPADGEEERAADGEGGEEEGTGGEEVGTEVGEEERVVGAAGEEEGHGVRAALSFTFDCVTVKPHDNRYPWHHIISKRRKQRYIYSNCGHGIKIIEIFTMGKIIPSP